MAACRSEKLTDMVMKQVNYVATLVGFALRHNPLFVVALITSIVSVGLEIAAMATLVPLVSVAAGAAVEQDSFVARVLSAVEIKPSGQSLLMVFIMLFAARIVSQFASQAFTILLSRRLMLQLASSAFSTLIFNMPLKTMESNSIGYYISLAGDETSRACSLVIAISQFVSLALLGSMYFVIIAAFSIPAAIGVVVFLLVTFALLFESFRISHRLGQRQIDQSKGIHSVFLDSLNGIRLVRAFSAERYVTASYHNQFRAYVRTLALVDLVAVVARLAPALLLLAGAALVVSWPALREGLSLELPFLVTITILLMRFFPIVGQALNLALRVLSDARAGRDVTHILSSERANSTNGDVAATPLDKIRRIDLYAVGFSHIDGKQVFSDLNLTIESGKSYALIGSSGSGKSTLLDLILHFYPAGHGRIGFNGQDIASLSEHDIRDRVKLVAQDSAIFNDTVVNNLKLGFEARDPELRRACRIACIDDFIDALPQGYETLLNYRGSNLSGGQKQRIGIARAVLRRPDVLLLDESTSALDAETREQVVTQLLEEFKDRIILFVTHDPFVVSKVDVVINMATLNDIPEKGPVLAGLGR